MQIPYSDKQRLLCVDSSLENFIRLITVFKNLVPIQEEELINTVGYFNAC